jgi:predicted RNA-binding protein with PUA-like domain
VDPSAFDRSSDYYDPKSKKDKPTWMMVEVEFVEKFPTYLTLNQLREDPALRGMLVIRPGMRLSVQPVSSEHFQHILKRAGSIRGNQLIAH